MCDQKDSFKTHPLRAALTVAAWLIASSALVLVAQAASMRLIIESNIGSLPHTLTLTCVDVFGILAALTTIPIMICYCSHTLYRHPADSDREIRLEWARKAKDSMALAGNKRNSSRNSLATIRSKSDIDSVYLRSWYNRLLTVGVLLMLPFPFTLYRYATDSLPAAYVWIGLNALVAAVILLRCWIRMKRNYPRIGMTESDMKKIVAEYSNNDQLASGLGKGTHRQSLPDET